MATTAQILRAIRRSQQIEGHAFDIVGQLQVQLGVTATTRQVQDALDVLALETE